MNNFLNATLPTWKITPTNSRQVSVRRSEKKKKKRNHIENLVYQIRVLRQENRTESLHMENYMQFTDPPNISKSLRVWFKMHCGCV